MTRGAAFSFTSILALGAMAACQAVLPTVPPAPVVVADKVTLDERAGIAVTTGYTAASRLGNVLSRAGLIDRKAFQALDNRGYAAVLAVRQAYLAGNAADYATAIRNAEAAITGIKDLAR